MWVWCSAIYQNGHLLNVISIYFSQCHRFRRNLKLVLFLLKFVWSIESLHSCYKLYLLWDTSQSAVFYYLMLYCIGNYFNILINLQCTTFEMKFVLIYSFKKSLLSAHPIISSWNWQANNQEDQQIYLSAIWLNLRGQITYKVAVTKQL